MSNAPTGQEDPGTSREPECDTLDLVIQPREKDLGGGAMVRRLLPFHKRRSVGPFVFFDHFGPTDAPPDSGMDVRPHPHIGLATVTYLFDGAIAHKDTVGSDLVIRPGAVNWMTAGRGIAHSERTPPEERASGQRIDGIQTWVALPVSHEQCDPSFEHHPAETIPRFEIDGTAFSLIAGEAWGHRSPVSFPHPIWYLAAETQKDSAFDIPASAAIERAVYVAEGSVTLGSETLEAGTMVILSEGCDVPVRAAAGAKFMLAGGAPYPEKRLIEWNFVASSRDLLEQAKSDWQASIDGNWERTPFAMPEGETEWIPLPR
ncbi:MAG: pirin family protein [Pseudomonadota bacterium]